MDQEQLRKYVIQATLERMDLWSADAEELLIATAAHESHLGRYIRQVGGGPAMGIYQMEPATHDDIWRNYLDHRATSFKIKIRSFASKMYDYLNMPPAVEMITNLAYATAMARLHYLRVPEGLPEQNDIQSIARYWKKYYNTPKGKGTEQQFIIDYMAFVEDG